MGIMHKNTASGAGVVNPAASAETVIYTTPAIQTGQGDGLVGITGTVNLTAGTGTTAVVIRIRQGSLTGPVVGVSPVHTLAAGASANISFGATDSTPFTEAAGGGVYVVTAQQTGGTGAGTTNMVDVEVIV
jgi:hypothetical protein